jgi:hypothetical protein
VATAKARLELAKQKSDLDGMFLALKELQALGEDSPEIGKELARVEAGLTARCFDKLNMTAAHDNVPSSS